MKYVDGVNSLLRVFGYAAGNEIADKTCTEDRCTIVGTPAYLDTHVKAHNGAMRWKEPRYDD